MSKSFEIGDRVVIEREGLGKITDIETNHNDEKEYRVEIRNTRFRVPVETASDVLRPPVSEERAKQLLDSLRRAHPDDRDMRTRMKEASYIRREEGLDEMIAVLGSLYATGADAFGPRRMIDELEDIALAEIAGVLNLDADDLADELREDLADVDRPPRPPELPETPEADVPSIPDDGPEPEEYEYLGSFRCRERLVFGDPIYVVSDESLEQANVFMNARTGAWDTYIRRDKDGLAEFLMCHRSFLPEGTSDSQQHGQLRVDTGRLAIVDADIRQKEGVAFELRDFSAGPVCRDWGAITPTSVGDGYYDWANSSEDDRVVAIRTWL